MCSGPNQPITVCEDRPKSKQLLSNLHRWQIFNLMTQVDINRKFIEELEPGDQDHMEEVNGASSSLTMLMVKVITRLNFES